MPYAEARRIVGPDRQVRHEVAVHDIPLDALDTRLLEGLTLLAQAGEVGG